MAMNTPALEPLAAALVVDPHGDTRKLNAAVLEPLGLETIEAEDGADALARAIVRPPALVLTEARLPRIDGYTLCSLLRADPSTRNTPIIVVTASVFPEEIERARRAGADDILAKPCTPEELREKARALITQARALRDRSGAALTRVRAQVERSTVLLERADAVKRRMMSRTHQREMTMAPPQPPPELRCPECDRPLVYMHSFVGGVSVRFSEQWDTFSCAMCGSFEYRHRTRKLRRL